MFVCYKEGRMCLCVTGKVECVCVLQGRRTGEIPTPTVCWGGSSLPSTWRQPSPSTRNRWPTYILSITTLTKRKTNFSSSTMDTHVSTTLSPTAVYDCRLCNYIIIQSINVSSSFIYYLLY